MVRNSYLLLSLLQAVLSEEWKVDTPRVVTAQEGLCAQIPCNYSYPSHLANQPQTGIWYNNEPKISSSIAFHSKDHNHESPRLRHRTWLTGKLKDGDCSLFINNITQEDAGPYYFRIEFNSDKFSYYPVTWLHIFDFTDKPTIFPAEIIAGKRVDLSCTFNTTCNGTAPVLTWVKPTDMPGSVSNSVTQHGITLTYTSVLTLLPSLKHHGQTLTCRVSYPSVSSERTLALTVQRRDSNEWKVGLIATGIILSVELAGFLIFKCVRKWNSTGRGHSAQAVRVSNYSPDKKSNRPSKKEEEDLEIKSNRRINSLKDHDIYENCKFDESPVYGNVESEQE